MTLDLPPSVDEAHARLVLAVGLFQDGTLTLGRAASVAGMSYRAFADALRDREIPLFEYTEEMFAQDLEFLDRFKEERGL